MSKRHKILRAICILAALLVPLSAFSKSAQMINNALLPSERFTGRVELIKEMHQTLETRNPVVTLIGITGIGKTQIVRQYTKNFQKQYDIIWFFDCANNLDRQFITLANELNTAVCKGKKKCIISSDPEYAVTSVKNFIEETKYKVLLVYDNMNLKKEIDLEKYLPETHLLNSAPKHIIIASQKAWTSNIPKINVPAFSEQETLELLDKYLPQKEISEKQALGIHYNNYPLMLVQAASYLNEHKFLSVKDLIQINTVESILEPEEKKLDAFVQKVLKEAYVERQNAYKLLILCALLEYRNLDISLLEKLAVTIIYNGRAVEFKKDLIYWKQYAILHEKSKKRLDKSYQALEMHDVVYTMLMRHLREQDITKVASKLIHYLNNLMKIDIEEIERLKNTYSAFILHIEAISYNIEKLNISQKEQFELKAKLLNYYSKYLYHNESKKIVEWVEKNIDLWSPEFMLSRQNGTVYYYLLNKAFLLMESNNILQGLEVYRKVLQIPLNSNKEHEVKASVYSEMAQAQIILGHIKDALGNIEAAEQNLKFCHKYSDEGLLYYIKARAQMENGTYLEALKSINTGIEYDTKNFGINGFTILSVALKIEILYRANLFAEVQQEILKINSDILQGIRPQSKSRLLNIIALGHISNKEIDKADKIIKENIIKLGEPVPIDIIGDKLAHALMIKGEIELQKRNYTEAIKYYKVSEVKYRKIYKDLSVDTMSNLFFKIAHTSILAGDWFEFYIYKVLHEKYFGKEHHLAKRFYKLELLHNEN